MDETRYDTDAFPGVGDLVEHGATPYVVSDIQGATTDNPTWQMRARYGGGLSDTTPVKKKDIAQWPVKARCGTWKQ